MGRKIKESVAVTRGARAASRNFRYPKPASLIDALLISLTVSGLVCVPG